MCLDVQKHACVLQYAVLGTEVAKARPDDSVARPTASKDRGWFGNIADDEKTTPRRKCKLPLRGIRHTKVSHSEVSCFAGKGSRAKPMDENS